MPVGKLHGKWKKDMQNSDLQSVSNAMDAMKLGRIQKNAATKLIDGLHLKVDQSDDTVTLEYLAKVPLPFKMQEQFKPNQPTTMTRRDRRSGGQTAILRKLEDDELIVEITWDSPHPGHVYETFRVDDATGKLKVHGVMELGDGKKYEVVQVYDRQT